MNIFALCLCAPAEMVTVTEEELIAERFLPKPARPRQSNVLMAGRVGVYGTEKTFEETIVEGVTACQAKIDVSQYQIAVKDFSALYLDALNRHPELFNVITTFGYSHDKVTVKSVSPKYVTTDSEVLATRQAEIDSAREKALGMIPPGASALEKALILHDYVVTHIDYDESGTRTNRNNIYGALVEHYTVCGGYTLVYNYLMTAAGVPADYVACKPLNHAWSRVIINGQKYHVDITWDDPVFEDNVIRHDFARHTYFLRSDTYFLREDESIPIRTHEGWDDMDTVKASDTTYDDFFWSSIMCQIPCINGFAYAFSSKGNGALECYDLSTGEAAGTLMTVDLLWHQWGSTKSYPLKYASVVRFGDNLIYNGCKSFYLYDLSERACHPLPSVTCPTTEGYIYGIRHVSANLIAAKVNKAPDQVCTYVDIPLYPVTGIALNKAAITLQRRDVPVELEATVSPLDATYPDVRWSSANPAVATVDSNGSITAVSNGSTTVTAVSKDSGLQADCQVTVRLSVTGVALDQTSVTLPMGGEALQLTATVSPEDAIDKSVAWSSSDTAVATVSDTGLVTPVGVGEADITVTTADGAFTAVCHVTVRIVNVTGVALDKDSAALVFNGNSLQLAAAVSPADATDKRVTWSSSDTAVATVSDAGLVAPVAVGEADITATTTDGAYTAVCHVTVRVVNVTGVALDRSSATLPLGGDALQLTVIFSPSDVSDRRVTWSSSNAPVAKVSPDGLVLPMSVGETDITVTTVDGDFTAVCHITAVYPPNTLFLTGGWNLIAFRRRPVTRGQFAGLVIFQCKEEAYIPAEELVCGKVYWVYSEADNTIIYDSEEPEPSEVVPASEWRLVGISGEALQVDSSLVECLEWRDGHFRHPSAGTPLKPGYGYLMRLRP